MFGLYRGGPGSIPRQSVWDFRLKIWNWGIFLSPPELLIYLIQYNPTNAWYAFIYHRHYKIEPIVIVAEYCGIQLTLHSIRQHNLFYS